MRPSMPEHLRVGLKGRVDDHVRRDPPHGVEAPQDPGEHASRHATLGAGGAGQATGQVHVREGSLPQRHVVEPTVAREHAVQTPGQQRGRRRRGRAEIGGDQRAAVPPQQAACEADKHRKA